MSFNSDGAGPYTGVTQGGDGNFYGTTGSGGTGGYGTIFRVTPAGEITTLHDFSALVGAEFPTSSDGDQVEGPLLQASDGNLYGTAQLGGIYGNGTIFKITPDGIFTTLHAFSATGPTTTFNPDGANPVAGLILGADGNLYGTAIYGGVNGNGTIFKITPDGVFTSLYSFSSTPNTYNNLDGACPSANLIQGNDGNFYGSTYYGGANGTGVIFKFTPAGVLTTLHNFGGDFRSSGADSDGEFLTAGLIQGRDGNLYGTSCFGGANARGTIFQITTAGVFTTLHDFAGDDGANPQGALLQGNDGSFYGTTSNGGAGGYGTIFKVTSDGTVTTLHDFDDADGAYPDGGLIQGSNGAFYGTTAFGGSNATGTIFAISYFPIITNLATLHLTVGQPFTYQITASNSPTSYLASGLPPGLTLDASAGTISGTPTTAGNYPVILSASNAYGTGSGVLDQIAVVVNAPPAISSAAKAQGISGELFSYQITASENPTSYGASGLPPGVTVNAQSGLLLGAPASAGIYTATLSATNGVGTGSATLLLSVSPGPPSITSATEVQGTMGTAFSYQIMATNEPQSYGVKGLPYGVSLDGQTGLISGTPTVKGTFVVAVTAVNSAGKGTADITLTINPPPQPPAISSANTAVCVAAVSFSYQITASNNPTQYSAQGLPPGVHVNGKTGLISGTPTTTGVFTVTLHAYNSIGVGSATLTLTCVEGLPVVSGNPTADGVRGTFFSYQIMAINGPTSYGATGLPTGLSVDAGTGLISGVPTIFGVFPVTISATNALGNGSMALNLVIATSMPTITAFAGGDGLAVVGGEKGKVVVRRAGDMSIPVTVVYKAKGSAQPGVDYEPLSGSITIPAGAMQAKIKIKPIGNPALDGTRVVEIKLRRESDSSYNLGTDILAKVRIIDGD